MKEETELAGNNYQRVAEELSRKLSHDIRTPFNANIGVLRLVLNEFESLGPETVQDLLKALLDSSVEQVWYLDLMLFWARFEMNKIEKATSEVPLSEILMTAGIKIDTFEDFKDFIPGNTHILTPAFKALSHAVTNIEKECVITASFLATNGKLRLNLSGTDQTRLSQLIATFPSTNNDVKLPPVASFAFYSASRVFENLSWKIERIHPVAWEFSIPL